MSSLHRALPTNLGGVVIVVVALAVVVVVVGAVGRGWALQSEGIRTRAKRGNSARCAVEVAPLFLTVRNTLTPQACTSQAATSTQRAS